MVMPAPSTMFSIPVTSLNLLLPVSLSPDVLLTLPPVRYPVDASCVTFKVCVPLTAEVEAETVA